MAFSEILQTVGRAGPFQLIHVFLLVLPVLMLASHNLMQNFSAATPRHHCRIPWLGNASLRTRRNLTEETLLRAAIPWEQDSPSSCTRYVRPQWQLTVNASADVSNLTEIEGCVDGWDFDFSSFSSTIITQWDLVCDKQLLKQMAQSVYMGGVLVGAIVTGGLADKFGRRSVMLASHLLVGILGVCAAFSPNLDIYILARFLTGAFLSGSVLNAFSLGLEWLDAHHRVHYTSFAGYCYTFGQFALAGCAYGIRDWRYLQVAASVPFIFFFLIGWFHPESSRWLMLHGNYNEALKGFKKVARINGKKEAGDALTIEILKNQMQSHHSEKPLQKTYTFVDLFRTGELRRRTLIVSFIWFATSFSYYGLAMNLHGFGFEIYIVMLMFAVADFPAKLGAFLIACYIGRRVALATLLFLAGCSCLALVFIPQDLTILRTIMAVIGKGCLGGSFNVVLLLTGEMYPTLIRQNAIGGGSTMARVGAMIAPLATIMGDLYPLLPQITYGATSIIAGFCTFYLPETLNAPLPDTMDDIKLQSCHAKRQGDRSSGEKQEDAKESPLLQKITHNKDVKCSFETSTNAVKIVEE
uniref:solute carrier family 22 member 6-B-like n=1 Tax=Myxine glutinosa TaxID=7769 RepID=UPI00358EFDD0